jgi:hypothetical protein
MYGQRVYAGQPYGAHLFDGREVYVRSVAIKAEFFLFFGPQVGVKPVTKFAVGGRIVGRTVPTGNLSGGIYIPPPIPGSNPPGSSSLGGGIGSSTRLRATLSGGRPVLALVGARINGRTNERVTLSGGSVRQITYLFPQVIKSSTSLYTVMDGGEPTNILTGTTAVSGTLSGGVVTKVVALQGYPIITQPTISGVMSGGRATLALAANSFGATMIIGTTNPGTSRPVVVSLATRVYTQPVIQGTLTGGRPYLPPPTPPVPTTGGVVLSGDVSMSAAFKITLTSPTVSSLPPTPGGPTDLPTGLDGSTVGSNPLVELLESIGYGVNGPASETVVLASHPVHLCGEDAHSPESALDNPIQANSDGTPSYSYERWVRVRFVPPFGVINALRFWVDMAAPIPDGWQIFWGWANGYQVPTVSQSQVAVSMLPLVDPGPLMPNFGDGVALSGNSVKYTPYIVLQAFYVPPLVAEQEFIEPLPGFTYNIGYLQA